MRKLILSLIAVAGIVVFSGCTGNTPHPLAKSKSGGEYRLWENKDGSFFINPLGDGPTLKEQLRIASLESQKKGSQYFVLLNTGVNNINGFPINTYSELVKYHTIQKRKPSFQTNGKNQNRGDCPLRTRSGEFQLWFKPVGNKYKNSYISVWSVEQTLRDTK